MSLNLKKTREVTETLLCSSWKYLKWGGLYVIEDANADILDMHYDQSKITPKYKQCVKDILETEGDSYMLDSLMGHRALDHYNLHRLGGDESNLYSKSKA